MVPAQQPKDEEAKLAETRMSLGEHLDELRKRLFSGVLTITLIFVAAYVFKEHVTRFAQRPFTQAMTRLEPEFIGQSLELLGADHELAQEALARMPLADLAPEAQWPEERFRTAAEGFGKLLDSDEELDWSDYFESGSDLTHPVLKDFRKRVVFIEPIEGFIYQLKICFYAAMVIGAPVLLWQMWQFIAAGLYSKEKRAVLRYFPLSILAFAAGISFGFLVIVPQGLYYINQTVSPELGIPNTSASTYLSFLLSLCLAFGFIFLLPLVMTLMGASGLVESRLFSKYRGEFLIGSFVISAFLTPPDPFTQVMMGGPMVLLYELGILGSKIAGKRRAAAEAAAEAELS